MLGVRLFSCSQIAGSSLLVCAVLKTLHSVKCILNEEECRSVGKASYWWWDELPVVIIVKPPGAVQESLGVLEEYKGDWCYDINAEGIKRKLAMFSVLCNVGAATTVKLYRKFPRCTLCLTSHL